MAGEAQRNIETKVLRNPTNKSWMWVLSLGITAFLAYILWSVYTGNNASILDIAIMAFLGLTCLYLSSSSWKRFYSPYEVEVGETVLLRYRRRTDLRNIESIEEIYFSPTHGKGIWSREFPWGGNECYVKFSGDKRGVDLTYEVAKALYDAYSERMGKVPPLALWSMTIG